MWLDTCSLIIDSHRKSFKIDCFATTRLKLVPLGRPVDCLHPIRKDLGRIIDTYLSRVGKTQAWRINGAYGVTATWAYNNNYGNMHGPSSLGGNDGTPPAMD